MDNLQEQAAIATQTQLQMRLDDEKDKLRDIRTTVRGWRDEAAKRAEATGKEGSLIAEVAYNRVLNLLDGKE